MKCWECMQGEMRPSTETYRYPCDVPVDLAGVTVWRCEHCGEFEVEIPRVEELHRVIATSVMTVPRRLTGSEIRLLRTYVGWSGKDFARRFGKTPETISRWENSKRPMDPMADVQLRLWVAMGPQITSYDGNADTEAAMDCLLMKQLLSMLEPISGSKQPKHTPGLRLACLEQGWEPPTASSIL